MEKRVGLHEKEYYPVSRKGSDTEAKVLAAKKEISISKLLSRELVRILSNEDLYESARKRATARLKKGFHLGGRILATREELNER